eukprot:SAG25_NODE_1763_length_2377_cov_3.015364_2_plen_53_part_00
MKGAVLIITLPLPDQVRAGIAKPLMTMESLAQPYSHVIHDVHKPRATVISHY